MQDPISITVEGGTQEQAGLIGDFINSSLIEAGFTNVSSQYEDSDTERDAMKALRNLNPSIFDVEINIDAIGSVGDPEEGSADDDDDDN